MIMRIVKNENIENTDFNERRNSLVNLLLNRCIGFSMNSDLDDLLRNELQTLIKDFLAVLSNDAETNISAIRSFEALQDDESRQIYACLFLCNIIKVYHGIGSIVFSKMVLLTLKNRLAEKGKNLSDYDNYDCNFFFNKQYFSLPQFKPSPENKEIFIDCGAFDGSTIKDFVEYCDGNYDKIYSFEPIPSQYENTLNNIKKWNIQNVELLQKGVWSGDAVFNFSENNAGSTISAQGTIPVEVTAIDSVVSQNENVTFIKMDIEGAEFEALKGAVNTIRRCKPKLAICIYHKPMDIIEIPIIILSIFPEYKFYIRHHYINVWETVLYALPK